jgi:hypothetical protein
MEGLAALVHEHIKADPFSGALHVSRAKRGGHGKQDELEPVVFSAI